jgi:hypothetical protein
MAAMGPNLSKPKEIAELGEKIYRERYQTQYEPTHQGKFLAIEVGSGSAYLGDTPEAAFTEARRSVPGGLFHLIRIGSLGAFRVSYTFGASANWLYQ